MMSRISNFFNLATPLNTYALCSTVENNNRININNSCEQNSLRALKITIHHVKDHNGYFSSSTYYNVITVDVQYTSTLIAIKYRLKQAHIIRDP